MLTDHFIGFTISPIIHDVRTGGIMDEGDVLAAGFDVSAIRLQVRTDFQVVDPLLQGTSVTRGQSKSQVSEANRLNTRPRP